MAASASEKSVKADIAQTVAASQAATAYDNFAQRLRVAFEVWGGNQAELSRATNISRQRINEYLAGPKVPAAATLFPLADALGVQPRWLVRGEGPMSIPKPGIDDGMIHLPHYELSRISTDGLGEPDDTIAVPPELLMRSIGTTRDLFVTDMPSDALPEIARAGETIVCQKFKAPLGDGKFYVFLFDGQPVVRRVEIRPEGLVLRAGDPTFAPIEVVGDLLDHLSTIARVLGALRLQPA